METENVPDETAAEGETATETTDDKTSQDEETQPDETATEDKDSELEELARTMGWKPEEEFKGRDGKKPVDAKTFIKSTVDVNKAQNVTIGKLTNDLDTIKVDVKKALKQQNAATADRISGLKSELNELKRAAIRDGDVDEVEKIDQKITAIDEKADDAVAEEEAQKEDPVLTAWKVNNDWYGNNIRLSRYADTIAEDYEDSGKSLKEILEMVDKEIVDFLPTQKQEAEPQKTKPKQARGVSDVVGNSNSGHSGKKHTLSDLPPDGQEMAKSMVKSGIFKNTQEYVDAYHEGIGE